jgi:hypothetical protein
VPDLLAAWALTLWVGGFWAIGYLAAPMLFYNLDDRMLAGMLAGKMFTGMPGWALSAQSGCCCFGLSVLAGAR